LWGNFLAKLKSTAILHRICDQELPPAEVLCIWEIFHLVVESFAEPPATFSASLELIQRGNSLAPQATSAAVQGTETVISTTPDSSPARIDAKFAFSILAELRVELTTPRPPNSNISPGFCSRDEMLAFAGCHFEQAVRQGKAVDCKKYFHSV
jgi:hypothetical protein